MVLHELNTQRQGAVMNKIDIENKLNELKDCCRVKISTSDRFIRIVYYSSIINDTNNNRLIFDINPPVSYPYTSVLNIEQSP